MYIWAYDPLGYPVRHHAILNAHKTKALGPSATLGEKE